jgi:hypothetical protein
MKHLLMLECPNFPQIGHAGGEILSEVRKEGVFVEENAPNEPGSLPQYLP